MGESVTIFRGSAPISSTRWRCRVCENHLSVRDLEVCGFTADLIVEMKDQLQPESKNRVLFLSNGTYRILEDRKQQYAFGKKRAHSEPASV